MRILLIIFVFIISGISTYLLYEVKVLKDSEKIAFVRSQDLLEKYKGMEEAKQAYSVKVDKWQVELENMESKYKQILAEYQNTSNISIKNNLKDNLEALTKSLGERQKALEKVSQDEDQRMVKAVLNKVNVFIHDYGKSNGYRIIFGITTDGNILYGSDAIDLTEPILEGLNKQFEK